MWNPLTEKEIPAFVELCGLEHVFGAKMVTDLRAYGLQDSRAKFFLYRQKESPVAALCLCGGVLAIVAQPQASPDDLANIALRAGVGEINTDRTLCAELKKRLGGNMNSSYFMYFQGGRTGEDFSDVQLGAPRAVFDVLRRSYGYYPAHYTYESWSADLKRKQTKGLAEVYLLLAEGIAVATGSITAEDDECGIVGAVAVLPEYRHRGFGTRISRFLTERIMEKGKTPRLMSGEDKVADLYTKSGYEVCGRWGQLFLE
jgi:GNAT superfamily N-acetyltransferase